MNVSKTLISAIAAASIVGAVSFAYAQTTSTGDTAAAPTTPSAEATQMPAPGTMGTQLPAGQDAIGRMQTPARDATMQKPVEYTPSAPAASTDSNLPNAASTPASDNTMSTSERLPKADRN